MLLTQTPFHATMIIMKRIHILKKFVRRTRSRVEFLYLLLNYGVTMTKLIPALSISKHPCASPTIARPRWNVLANPILQISAWSRIIMTQTKNIIMPQPLPKMRLLRTWIILPGSKIVRSITPHWVNGGSLVVQRMNGGSLVVQWRATMEWFLWRSLVVQCSLRWWRYCFDERKRYIVEQRHGCKPSMIIYPLW